MYNAAYQGEEPIDIGDGLALKLKHIQGQVNCSLMMFQSGVHKKFNAPIHQNTLADASPLELLASTSRTIGEKSSAPSKINPSYGSNWFIGLYAGDKNALKSRYTPAEQPGVGVYQVAGANTAQSGYKVSANPAYTATNDSIYESPSYTT